MRVKMWFNLADEPGQLLRILQPIAEFGGNIREISHLREEKKGNFLPVVVTFDVKDLQQFLKIKEAIEAAGVQITSTEPHPEVCRKIVIMVGHVFATNIKDTIDRVLERGVRVKRVVARIKSAEEASTVKFILEADAKDKLERTIRLLKKIADEKRLFIVWS
ncbi:MAG: ACT domain-containing protein [Candidatus Freyarchaeota archaeon]|nr:ACT domain-containing protein [Candidatus Freyrarchaeum guaymaensis]